MDNNNFEYSSEEKVETVETVETTSENTYSYDAPVEPVSEGGGLNVLGLIGMICGILGVVAMILCCCLIGGWSGCIAVVLGIPAIILGIIGAKKRPDKKALATVSLILGIVCVVLGGLFVILAIVSTILINTGVIEPFDFSDYNF